MRHQIQAVENRWIVTAQDFLEHQTPGLAENERRRLVGLFPHIGNRFRIYRIKRLIELPILTGQIVNEIVSIIEDGVDGVQSRTCD